MARQSKTINPKGASALSQLERMTNLARGSGRIARASASIDRAKTYRWQVPLALGLKGESVRLGRGTADDGSRGGSGAGLGRHEAQNPNTTRHRATALVEAATRSHRQIPELSHAMKALSRIEQSVEYVVPTTGLKTNPTGRGLTRLDSNVPSFAEKGLLANGRIARSIRGVTPPSNVSRREFAQPSGNARVSSEGSGRGGITINSSPTVVINGSGGGAVQHDVISALRAHREELFDQLKRESARRERAQF